MKSVSFFVVMVLLAVPFVAFAQDTIPIVVDPDSIVGVILSYLPASAVVIVGLVVHFTASILNTMFSDKTWFGALVKWFSLAIGPRGKNDPVSQ